MTKKKKLSEKEALKIIGGSLDLWGSHEKGSPPKPKNPDHISLVPVDKNGNDIEWYGYGWPGVVRYAQSLGIDYTTVGNWLEKNFGNRATFYQIMLAQAVHKSLSMIDYYRRPRLKMAPTGKESDMHYAIRMDQKNIFKLYEKAGGKAKDKFKGIAKMYSQLMQTRRSYVEAYLPEEPTKKENKKLAKAIGKSIKSNLFSKAIKKKQ